MQLVESYRNAEGQPRQRVVASLGDADIPKVEKPLIASAVKRRLKGDSNWFEPELSAVASEWVARIVQLAGRSRGTRTSIRRKTGWMVTFLSACSLITSCAGYGVASRRMEIGENGRRSVASGGATHWSRRGCRWRTGESSSCANRACRTRNIPRSSASSELIERRSARRRRRKSNRDRFCSAFCGKIEGLRAIHGLNKKLGLADLLLGVGDVRHWGNGFQTALRRSGAITAS